jgi:hypothetical protein
VDNKIPRLSNQRDYLEQLKASLKAYKIIKDEKYLLHLDYTFYLVLADRTE